MLSGGGLLLAGVDSPYWCYFFPSWCCFDCSFSHFDSRESRMRFLPLPLLVLSLLQLTMTGGAVAADQLPGSRPLKLEGDIPSQLVAGVDRFLLRHLEASIDPESSIGA